ncbi:MAG: hypothetical protein V1874_06040 [Spirochaetota bacterium]
MNAGSGKIQLIQEYNINYYQIFCGCLIFFSILFSCSTANIDLRRLEQPVILNANPYIGDQKSRPALIPVDKYEAKVGEQITASSYNSKAFNTNEAQVQAFKKIGGDNTKIINNVNLDIETVGINGCLVLSQGAKITIKGDVQKADKPIKPEKGK